MAQYVNEFQGNDAPLSNKLTEQKLTLKVPE